MASRVLAADVDTCAKGTLPSAIKDATRRPALENYHRLLRSQKGKCSLSKMYFNTNKLRGCEMNLSDTVSDVTLFGSRLTQMPSTADVRIGNKRELESNRIQSSVRPIYGIGLKLRRIRCRCRILAWDNS